MTYFVNKLSIIIPVYNEKKTIQKLLNKVFAIKNLTKEIIVIDDFSTDGTRNILKNNKSKINKLIFHTQNLGKGAAIQSGKKFITGDVVIIQDADLEYNPNDYFKLLKKIKEGYKVVYGSRVLGKKRYLLKNFLSLSRIFFNHMLTIFSNIINNQNLTDAHTCYKMFRSNLFLSIPLREKDFSFCPEITTKLGLRKVQIQEVSIDYFGRQYSDGKKIKFIDGIKALIVLLKYRFYIKD